MHHLLLNSLCPAVPQHSSMALLVVTIREAISYFLTFLLDFASSACPHAGGGLAWSQPDSPSYTKQYTPW